MIKNTHETRTTARSRGDAGDQGRSIPGDVLPAVDSSAATFDVIKQGSGPVLENAGAWAWDLGDGILGFQFRTKMNVLDADVVTLLDASVARAEDDFRGFVIANEGKNFSLGGNLLLLTMAAIGKQFDVIAEMVDRVQATAQRLRYARVPVVAAPFGMTLGGGLEICLAVDEVQAAAETYAGLAEVGVGLVPAGGGCMNSLYRALGAKREKTAATTREVVMQVFQNIGQGKVSSSAVEAQALGFFRTTDGVSLDRRRRIVDAKARAIGLAEAGYRPPPRRAFVLPGEPGIASIDMMVASLRASGLASEHDALIARKLGVILNGGSSGHTREVTEQDLLELEREAFVSLCGEPKTVERLQHMLENKRVLRN